MFLEHFQLRADPFAPVPDPAFFFASPQHEHALAAVEYGLRERRGFLELVGEVGTGKTTILMEALQRLSGEVDAAYVTHTTLSFPEMLRFALTDLGVATEGRFKGELVEALNAFLGEQRKRGRLTAIIIDEAQNLSAATFEEIRLLTNFETFEHKLLQIVLVGQPELDDKLDRREVRQLRERLTVRVELGPLRRRDVPEYIDHRMRIAGRAASEVFESAAIRDLARISGGNPRRIHTLGHGALLAAYADGSRSVGSPHVRAKAAELGWRLPLRKRLRRAAGRLSRELAGLSARRWAAAAVGLVLLVGGIAAATGERGGRSQLRRWFEAPIALATEWLVPRDRGGYRRGGR